MNKCAIEHDLAAYDQRQSCAEQAEAKSAWLLDQFYKMDIDDLIWQLEQCNQGGTAVSRQKVKQLVNKIEESLKEIAEIMSS